MKERLGYGGTVSFTPYKPQDIAQPINPEYRPYHAPQGLEYRLRENPPLHSVGPHILKKKTGTLAGGWILLIFGLVGLILALTIYPIWQNNREVLAEKEFYGADTPEGHATYDTQTVVVVGGFIVGIPVLLAGAYLVASASSYNRKIDGALIQKAMQPSQSPQPATGSIGYCYHCGHRIDSSMEFCPGCGKKLG